jgi:lipopolysaccharide export system protein LptA
VTRVAVALIVGCLVAAAPGFAQAPRKAAPAKESDGKAQPVTVDADKMERYGKEGLVVFSGTVVARQNNSVQYADRMEVYFDERGDRIVRTVSTGSVKIITRDCRTATAKRAEYYDLEQRLVLIGGARVWEDENIVTGETITIFLSQDRSTVQGSKQGDRVKAIIYPKEQKDGAAAPAPKKDAKAPCVN